LREHASGCLNQSSAHLPDADCHLPDSLCRHERRAGTAFRIRSSGDSRRRERLVVRRAPPGSGDACPAEAGVERDFPVYSGRGGRHADAHATAYRNAPFDLHSNSDARSHLDPDPGSDGAARPNGNADRACTSDLVRGERAAASGL
jgi:hypothetical protein